MERRGPAFVRGTVTTQRTYTHPNQLQQNTRQALRPVLSNKSVKRIIVFRQKIVADLFTFKINTVTLNSNGRLMRSNLDTRNYKWKMENQFTLTCWKGGLLIDSTFLWRAGCWCWNICSVFTNRCDLEISSYVIWTGSSLEGHNKSLRLSSYPH